MTMKPIRILENDPNRRGDLFGRLMADLFVALGYNQPRLNIHKSGRELDLSADHRLETRRAIGECKATVTPIGGDEINKFVGALDAERKGKVPTTGYFISLAGFKETAMEQEKQGRRTRIITLNGKQVLDELVNGRLIIPKDRATDVAGRCCALRPDLDLDLEPELLAHERGWIWSVYYTSQKLRTHAIFIHADGTPLARALAEEVIQADQQCGGILHTLECLNPDTGSAAAESQSPAALAAYAGYIDTECGYIQLDGLPADADVGSRRLRLENLFVPLHLDIAGGVGEGESIHRQAVGEVLHTYSRIAILAAPGGGKSTLLKRLAIAYVDPARRKQISDDLPDSEWLPLFFRCRELRGLARNSFADLLRVLSEREPVRQYAEAFRAQVDRALLDGRVLLLIDGLDEISDPGDRAAFVGTLRTALQAYPGTGIVVTSREAGFRHVAAHLAPVCRLTTLSPFNDEDIERLSVAWHQEVIGHKETVRQDAEELASTIARNDRIRRLAVNPLLLTTLFLVRRWIGSLPTRRAILYGEAVKVLLRTWNIEGHDPMPEEEALPQLCYLASAMLLGGMQKISRPRLAALLQEARDALPTELGYVKGTVDEFIHRIEDRSSLVMMTGYDVEDNRLVEFFEFRHLTFQEYLTARAMVEGWHPGSKEEDTLVDVLEPHFEREDWREVIPLASVLGGKATEPLIQRLTKHLSSVVANERRSTLFSLVGNCLADEAAARPETIRAALRQLVRLGSWLPTETFTPVLMRGRYGVDFRDEAGKALLTGLDNLGASGDALTQAVWWQTLGRGADANYETAGSSFADMLRSPSRLSRCEGATGIGKLCFYLLRVESREALARSQETLQSAGPLLVRMLKGSPAETCAALYAIAPLAGLRVWLPPPTLLGQVLNLWRFSSEKTTRNLAARAFAAQPLLSRDEARSRLLISAEELDAILNRDPPDPLSEQYATIVISWYLGVEPDAETVRGAKKVSRGEAASTTLSELLDKIEDSSH
jgi:hypothetical protein